MAAPYQIIDEKLEELKLKCVLVIILDQLCLITLQISIIDSEHGRGYVSWDTGLAIMLSILQV